jgi:cold shock CspA family protein
MKNKNKKVTGKIRWYDKLTGEGQIRLSSGESAWFFACNVVGANSCYPQLVTNVSFETGDDVTCEISQDEYIFNALGFINIARAC